MAAAVDNRHVAEVWRLPDTFAMPAPSARPPFTMGVPPPHVLSGRPRVFLLGVDRWASVWPAADAAASHPRSGGGPQSRYPPTSFVCLAPHLHPLSPSSSAAHALGTAPCATRTAPRRVPGAAACVGASCSL